MPVTAIPAPLVLAPSAPVCPSRPPPEPPPPPVSSTLSINFLPSFYYLDAACHDDRASNTSSECDELENLHDAYDDMNASFRWADSLADPPLACKLDVSWDDSASDLALSLDRPISPSDIRNFPYLTKTLAPVEDPSSDNPFAAKLDELIHDSIVPMPCLIRSVGIQDEYRLVRLERDTISGLCDGVQTSAWVLAVIGLNSAVSEKSNLSRLAWR